MSNKLDWLGGKTSQGKVKRAVPLPTWFIWTQAQYACKHAVCKWWLSAPKCFLNHGCLCNYVSVKEFTNLWGQCVTASLIKPQNNNKNGKINEKNHFKSAVMLECSTRYPDLGWVLPKCDMKRFLISIYMWLIESKRLATLKELPWGQKNCRNP